MAPSLVPEGAVGVVAVVAGMTVFLSQLAFRDTVVNRIKSEHPDVYERLGLDDPRYFHRNWAHATWELREVARENPGIRYNDLMLYSFYTPRPWLWPLIIGSSTTAGILKYPILGSVYVLLGTFAVFLAIALVVWTITRTLKIN